ncbi:hypothetical protein PAEPH01_1863 [Pancytospora epiphaga]|nr:hypothetical protein PAEPH01_1863 [Pancytospora epiphaga]
MNDIAASVYREDSNRIFYTGNMGRYSLVPGRERAASGDASFRLPLNVRIEARNRSREMLRIQGWFSRTFSCYGGEVPSTRGEVTPTIFSLISYLDATATKTEGIFRREGSKKTTPQIVSKIIEFDKRKISSSEFNFAEYSPLELASALKYYIRETMNGLFSEMYVPKALSVVTGGNHKDGVLYSKYLLLTLTDDQQKLFMMLKKMFEKIVENKDDTKITWESIFNIFGLTLMPLEIFSSIERVPIVIDLFRSLINVNLDDLGMAVKSLQAK